MSNQMPNFYQMPNYKYFPHMYQVSMLNPTTGQVVNNSTIFYNLDDFNRYLYCIENLSSVFKILVSYQTVVWKNKYEYDFKQGRWFYDPPKVKYEPPTAFVSSTPSPSATQANSHNETFTAPEETPTHTTRVAETSGFNFHFDPPANLNMVVNPNQDSQNSSVSNEAQDNFTQYDDSVVLVEPEPQQQPQDDNSFTDEEDLNADNYQEDPDYNPQNDIEVLLNDIEDDFEAPNFVGTSTPPPVDEDHWNVIQSDETYEEMTLEKYGRGYILKVDEEHPDYGIKYYPSQSNCRGWWQDNNKGWFIQRENKNYFLERGAVFIHHNSQHNSQHKKRQRKRNKRQRY